MKLFIESSICTSRVHCGTCRDKINGVKFRTENAKFFTMPSSGANFECPFGNPWEYKPDLRGAGDAVAKLFDKLGIRPCTGCIDRAVAWNKAIPFVDKVD